MASSHSGKQRGEPDRHESDDDLDRTEACITTRRADDDEQADQEQNGGHDQSDHPRRAHRDAPCAQQREWSSSRNKAICWGFLTLASVDFSQIATFLIGRNLAVPLAVCTVEDMAPRTNSRSHPQDALRSLTSESTGADEPRSSAAGTGGDAAPADGSRSPMANPKDAVPLLHKVPESAPAAVPAPSLRRTEGEALAAMGAAARSTALTLPEVSELRAELLESADRYCLLAQLRGVRAAPPLVAASPRSG